MTKAVLQPLRGGVDVGDTVIKPESNLRKRLAHFHDSVVVVSVASDGVKVGNIKTLECMDRHYPAHHVDRIASARKRCLDWLVEFAPSHSCVNHYSAF